jgi:hypothetical protein
MKKKIPILPFSSDDFNWCVKNNFQVYGRPDHEGKLRIAIRRGGIITEGKDYIIINGVNMNELSLYLPAVYKQLREQYG